MDRPQHVEGEEEAHAILDREGRDRSDSNHLANREQVAASDRPISLVEAPRPHKRTLMDPEALLKGESSPFRRIAPGVGDLHELPTWPHPNAFSFTPPAGKNTGPSIAAARNRTPRQRVYISCASCKRRKIRCNGGKPCVFCQESKIDCVYTARDRQGLRTRDDEFAIKALEVIEQRGRTRFRENSPPLFKDSDRALSHSPTDSFYHDDPEDPEDDSETKLFEHDAAQIDAADMYQYAPLGDADIRLLRIEPGLLQEPIHCTLKVLPLTTITASALEFQALSYAWAHDYVYNTVSLVDAPTSGLAHGPEDEVPNSGGQQIPRPFRVHENLFNALKRIRHEHDSVWIWVDALCIDQKNDSEKSHQIPKMPDIYSNAWNVVVWLGDVGDRRQAQEKMDGAVKLIPKLLNLKVLESMLRSNEADYDLLESWVSFMDILYLPWFTRRWVIQEIACARRLSLRIGGHVISWIDFADAVELFLDKLDRMRDLYGRSHRARYNPDALEGVKTSGARALMELSRNVFRKGGDAQALVRLMDLESLVLSTTAFAVTEIRDVIYALLHLANDVVDETSLSVQGDASKRPFSFSTDYSRHPVDVFSDFVIYCITKSQSLDIICRHWTIWPQHSPEIPVRGRALPSWIGAASCTQDDLYDSSPRVPRFNLVGAPQKPVYAASREIIISWEKSRDALEVTGLIIQKVGSVSARVMEGIVSDESLRMLGWTGSLADGLPDRLWRSLVANRTSDGRMVPGWYRRACALALTKLTTEGDLNVLRLLADASQPSTMIEYLKRVQEVAQSRKFFTSTSDLPHHSQDQEDDVMDIDSNTVGLGPRDMRSGDFICILFGCTVPVILRPVYKNTTEDASDKMLDARLIGEAYVHDYMEGEIFAGLTKEEAERRSTTFRIH